jgi:hypothetical protein
MIAFFVASVAAQREVLSVRTATVGDKHGRRKFSTMSALTSRKFRLFSIGMRTRLAQLSSATCRGSVNECNGDKRARALGSRRGLTHRDDAGSASATLNPNQTPVYVKAAQKNGSA